MKRKVLIVLLLLIVCLLLVAWAPSGRAPTSGPVHTAIPLPKDHLPHCGACPGASTPVPLPTIYPDWPNQHEIDFR